MSTPGPRPPARPPRQRRPLSPRSPLEGRQLWRVGDWGGASEQIGRRWEELGTRPLRALLGVARPGPDGREYVPREAIVLAAEPALAAQVHAHGKTHADALLVGTMDGRAILEPVDFKWTLETANPKQVGAEVLEALLDAPPPLLAEALERALAAVGHSAEGLPTYHDGFFLAPDSAPNRAFLAPRGPLDPVWAALVPVDAAEFFPPLPGWHVAQALAHIDHSRLDRLEQAERYYRLGAGVRGAVRKLRAGIFAEAPPELDDPAELERLRRERRLRTVGEVISYLDRALTARSELLERLRQVERAGYPFGRFMADLRARGIEPRPGERRWGAVYGGIMKTLAAEVRAAGRELVAAGRSESEALAELASRQADWTALARRLLEQSLSAV